MTSGKKILIIAGVIVLVLVLFLYSNYNIFRFS